MQFIDLSKQYKSIEQQIDNRIKKVLEHTKFIMGPEVYELEEQLAHFVKIKHCISVSSGTDALLIALMALDLKPGDEVVTTAFSFFATAETIMLLGLKPVFVDIDPSTFQIDPNLIEQAITARTKVLMPVSLFGQTGDMDLINTIAAKYHLVVIEDGAQSFGATYKGKKSCGLSTIGCTSFFPSKPLGCYGDGGAIFTEDDILAKKMRELRVHGQAQRYVHSSLGVCGRFDTIQAAILLEKFTIFELEIVKRQQIVEEYSKHLRDYITLPFVPDYNKSVFAQYTIRTSSRDALAQYLQKMGIPTAIHYPAPLTKQPVMQHLECAKIALPHSELAANEVLSLPMHPYLTEAEIAKISEAVINFIKEPIEVLS
ncbi:MAG: DegT/DnrJ/EryC1/StrS family aminotransferase [Proteobacteria bacterium]|nr:DegT/DnrJ/EryC1/StrS family aminotransferase [Pseudomonadota bacterium]